MSSIFANEILDILQIVWPVALSVAGAVFLVSGSLKRRGNRDN
jgi:hypothetical protein